MSFRHLISSAFVFAALCATASAQGLEREWTIPYPYGTLPSISSDGGLFARTLSTTEIVRYNGATGLIRDTVTTPFVESPDRVAFCGNTLYLLAGTRNDSLNMYRCAASATQCDSTPYTFRFAPLGPIDHSDNVKSVGLYSVPHYPRVLLRSWIQFADNVRHIDYDYGKCEEIDTATYLPTLPVESSSWRVSWSAEPAAFVRHYFNSTIDKYARHYITRWQSCTETYHGIPVSEETFVSDGNGDGEAPLDFRNAVHSGALHNIIFSGIVFDMVARQKVDLSDRSGKILASLYPPTYVLKTRKGAGGDVMSAYHYLNGTTHDLDTVPSCDQVWINGPNAIMYMLDTLSKTLTRYRIAPYSTSDTAVLSVDSMRQKILTPINLTATVYSTRNNGHKTIVTVGDSTGSSTKRTVSMLSTQVGEQPTTVMVVDTLLNDTIQAQGPPVTIYRAEKNIMVSNESNPKLMVHGCSPLGDDLLIGNYTALHSYRIPLIPADQAYAPKPLTETYGFGSYYTNDSMRIAVGEIGDRSTYFRFYNTDVTMSDLTLVDTMTIWHAPMFKVPDNVRFTNQTLYNPATRQHITLFRVENLFDRSSDYGYDGVWLHPSEKIKTGRWLMKGGFEPNSHGSKLNIMHVDASFGSTLLITENNWIRCVDLALMDTLFMIDRFSVGYPFGAIQVDSETIVTTKGILKGRFVWEREHEFIFKDGIKVFRMDSKHSLILRLNARNVACVIDHATGSIVEDIGEGFGDPVDGAYDPVRNLLHVVDSQNFLSTYTVGTPVGVDEEPPRKVVDQQLHVTSTAAGRYRVLLPNGMNTIRVFDVTGRCVIATSVEDRAEAVEFDMPNDQHAGVYLIVAFGEQGRSTSHFLHLH